MKKLIIQFAFVSTISHRHGDIITLNRIRQISTNLSGKKAGHNTNVDGLRGEEGPKLSTPFSQPRTTGTFSLENRAERGEEASEMHYIHWRLSAEPFEPHGQSCDEEIQCHTVSLRTEVKKVTERVLPRNPETWINSKYEYARCATVWKMKIGLTRGKLVLLSSRSRTG